MSFEAEKAVLGIILTNPKRLDDAIGHIDANTFNAKPNIALWLSLMDLHNRNEPIDPITVCSDIEKNNLLHTVDMTYISCLCLQAPSNANFIAHLKILKSADINKKLIQAATQISEVANSKLDSDEKINSCQEIIQQISESKKSGGAVRASDLATEYIGLLEKRLNGYGRGISSGFKDLDRLTGGLNPGDLVIVAGRPSMGKTTFGLNICETCAINGFGTLIFSMEMTALSLIEKTFSSLGKVNLNELKNAKALTKDNNPLVSPLNKIIDANMHIDDTGGLTISELRSRARIAHRKNPLKVIMVDYLQLIGSKGENRTQQISNVSIGLKQMAKELNCVVIALSQLNRGVENRQDKEPQLSDLRESGQIEQDADLILMMYRHEYYYPDDFNYKGKATAFVRKHRQGETGQVDLLFEGMFSRFTNFDGEPIVYAPKEQVKENAKRDPNIADQFI